MDVELVEASMSTHRFMGTQSVQITRNSTYRSRACVDVLPIRFHHIKVGGNYNLEDGLVYDLEPPVLLLKKTLKLRFSRERASGDAKTTMERFAKYQRVIAQSPREANKLRQKLGRYLSTAMGLPEHKHPYVIDQVMKKLQHAVPDKILEVEILDMILRDMLVESTEDDSFYRNKLIPATESFIQALEEASPPDDELECAICMEMFAQKKDSSITQLPCSHYFHRDCIVPWLHINHLCPTCRRPTAPSR